jgi:hypothetical protein
MLSFVSFIMLMELSVQQKVSEMRSEMFTVLKHNSFLIEMSLNLKCFVYFSFNYHFPGKECSLQIDAMTLVMMTLSITMLSTMTDSIILSQ